MKVNLNYIWIFELQFPTGSHFHGICPSSILASLLGLPGIAKDLLPTLLHPRNQVLYQCYDLLWKGTCSSLLLPPLPLLPRGFAVNWSALVVIQGLSWACSWGVLLGAGSAREARDTISGAEFRMQTGDGCKERSCPGWELQAAKGLSEWWDLGRKVLKSLKCPTH